MESGMGMREGNGATCFGKVLGLSSLHLQVKWVYYSYYNDHFVKLLSLNGLKKISQKLGEKKCYHIIYFITTLINYFNKKVCSGLKALEPIYKNVII